MGSFFSSGDKLKATVGGNDAVEDYGISLCKLTKTTEDFEYYTGFQPRFTVSFRTLHSFTGRENRKFGLAGLYQLIFGKSCDRHMWNCGPVIFRANLCSRF